MEGRDTVESLTLEAARLREKLAGVEKRLEEKRKLLRSFTMAIPYTPKKTTTVEWRPQTPTTMKREGKRDFGDLEGEGKRRKKVGGLFDPEVERILGPVVGVKVGGVTWEVGVKGVLAGLEALGCVICEGSRWLVGEEELKKRREGGKTSSTVVAMVRGEKEVGALYRQGLWLAGWWCSVKRFVAVQPMRKEAGWKRVMGVLEAHVKEHKIPGLNRQVRDMRLSVEERLKVVEVMVREGLGAVGGRGSVTYLGRGSARCWIGFTIGGLLY